MTTIATRSPLQMLTMATTQRTAPRRHSARLMEKEDMAPPPPPATNGYYAGTTTDMNAKSKSVSRGKQATEGKPGTRKRKAEYDEEADGFQFTRSKRRTKAADAAPLPPSVGKEATPRGSNKATITVSSEPNGFNGSETAKSKGKKKMTFATPDGETRKKEEKPRRRSKRISNEAPDEGPSQRAEIDAAASAKERPLTVMKRPKVVTREEEENGTVPGEKLSQGETATKIALPFADTPVIRRNKEMRQGKGGKTGERRSSLGLRGRRASSLIESGNSNALPHNEVEYAEFYKHIESEGLSEPRRMRQLLTWCATRAIVDKPSGTNSGNESERMAARVIQEELLKDFSDKSEMSDWFNRDDVPAPTLALMKKPNPKNVQNATKIQELEEQIKRLNVSLKSLESLLDPPPIPSFQLAPASSSTASEIDPSLLPPEQQSLLQSIISPHPETTSTSLSTRINTITSNLEPTVDRFADGTHRLRVFKDTAEKVAGRVLENIADGLEKRSRSAEDREEEQDVRDVLRALSRVDR